MNPIMKFVGILKRGFDSRNIREQLLLCIIIVGVFLWGAFEVLNRMQSISRDSKIAASKYNNQQIWLDDESNLDTRLEEALGELDPSKTYSSNQLLEVMDTIVKEVQLQTSINRPSSQQGKVFSEHVLIVPISRTSIETLIKFENTLKNYYPYLGIDSMLIEPEPSAPELLRGEVRVSSFELNS